MHVHISPSMGPRTSYPLRRVVCITPHFISLSYISHWSRAARMSVIFSIIRVSKHTVHRQIIYFIAAFFLCMWAAMLAQKLTVCYLHRCHMGKMVGLSQLISEYFFVFCVDAKVLIFCFLQRTSSRMLHSLPCHYTSGGMRSSPVVAKFWCYPRSAHRL